MMTEYSFECVLDANVAVKLYINQPFSDKAIALLDLLQANKPAKFYIPEFFYAECANVLWQYVRLAAYPPQEAKNSLENLKQLDLQVIDTFSLISESMEIAISCGIAVYDACYVELANRLNIPLVTADKKLINALSSRSYIIQSLETLVIPSF
ncbi:type II toxin-antitoxin system VapC family toxin [Floridanema evergladense]|uniref:Ribonuclease VapC n=1 Tax=Floridaenema evergladense BLCC-F167 TaxID=3153639 RepID=A0ABV4WTN4_9CYAN